MRQKIIRSGNSLVVSIPSKFAKTLGLKLGDEIEIVPVPEEGQLTLYFPGAKQLSLLAKK